MSAFKSIIGNALGIGDKGQLASRISGTTVVNVTQPCVNVTGTIGAEASDARAITLTFKDAKGVAISYAENVELILYSSSAMTDFTATGGSTGIAAGASGKLLAQVAKKVFKGITTTAGVIACTYTDTGTDAVYLGVRLPNGRVVGIGSLTNA